MTDNIMAEVKLLNHFYFCSCLSGTRRDGGQEGCLQYAKTIISCDTDLSISLFIELVTRSLTQFMKSSSATLLFCRLIKQGPQYMCDHTSPYLRNGLKPVNFAIKLKTSTKSKKTDMTEELKTKIRGSGRKRMQQTRPFLVQKPWCRW